MTVEEAKELKYGTTLYYAKATNSDGTPQRWRVNGKPKTWKTRPDDVQVPLKRGLREYGYLTPEYLADFYLDEEEAQSVIDKDKL